jgi:hypothetical protein
VLAFVTYAGPAPVARAFTEAKELIGGLAILQADSKEAAIELAKQFLKVAGDGECELRQLFDAEEKPQARSTAKS